MRRPVLAAVATLCLAGCSTTTTGTAQHTDSGTATPVSASGQPVSATISGDALAGLALPVPQAETILGTPLPTPATPQRRVIYLPQPGLDKQDCAPFWDVGQKHTYDGSGWIDAWGPIGAVGDQAPIPQRFSQPQMSYASFLATYPSPGTAKAALQVFAAALQKCQTDQFNIDDMSWITDKVAYSQPTIVATSMFELDGRHEGCAVRIGAKANVTVELHLCGDKDTIGAQADTAITAALARISA